MTDLPILHPDDLCLGVEVDIDPTKCEISLHLNRGNMTVDGVSVQALYSFLKESWRDDVSLILYRFPLCPIIDETGKDVVVTFEFEEDWSMSDAVSYSLLRTEQKFIKLYNHG